MNSYRSWIAVFSLFVLLAASSAVLAYGKVRRSDPAPGARLTLAPSEVFIWFDEPPRNGSAINVFDTDFNDMAAGLLRIDADDATLMRLLLKSLSPGRYTVRWRLHTDSGTYTGVHDFIVESPPLSISSILLVTGGIVVLVIAIAAVVVRATQRR